MEQVQIASDWCVVVPAGGGGRRLGGVDKPAVEIGGQTLLGHLLAGLPPGVPVAVVGPERPGLEPADGLGDRGGGVVVSCREDPPGGGPAAAVAAGVEALARRGLLADVVVVVPGDAPWSAAAVPSLLTALEGTPDADSAVAVDAEGRRQVLVAAHRSGPLQERLAALARHEPDLAGMAAHRLLPPPPALLEVRVSDAVLADVDTPEDLAALRRAAARGR